MVDPLVEFEEKAKATIREAMQSLGTQTSLPMEIPPAEIGDFAFPCFAAARELQKSPQEIAEALSQHIDAAPHFEKVEVKGPYINFHINQEMLALKTLAAILEMREEYGSFEPNGKKILLEHTSANPNNPLHVGRARNPIIGDTLARILRKVGYEVIAEFYVDDMGKQQVTLTWGVENAERLKSLGEISQPDPAFSDKPDHQMVGVYQAATKLLDEEDVLAEIDAMVALYEDGDSRIASVVRKNCELVMEGILQSLRRMDIHFDSIAWESDYVIRGGAVKSVIQQLANLDVTDYEDNALYLDLDKFGIKGRENKFYLTRSDGSSLYSTRDVAYHLDKLARCDEALNVLGEDHKLKARVVNICLELLGSDRVADVVFYSFVALPEGKMSARKGRVVYLDGLMDEAVERAMKEVEERRPDLPDEIKHGIAVTVGIGAIRYNIIRVQAEKSITFKWEEALNFEGNSAPFIQYSHARCSSILRKDKGSDLYNPNRLVHESEVQLLKALARLPMTIKKCGEARAPHYLASYAYEVASLFNQFYRDCPVLTADEPLKDARLALVQATKWTLKNALDTLGITAPEEM